MAGPRYRKFKIDKVEIDAGIFSYEVFGKISLFGAWHRLCGRKTEADAREAVKGYAEYPAKRWTRTFDATGDETTDYCW